MNRPHFAHRYTGARIAPFAPPAPFAAYPPPAAGFCRSCGHPSAQCQCGCRECRKEARELLVEPAADQTDEEKRAKISESLDVQGIGYIGDNVTIARTDRTNTAFIGGGCCVHISVEYAPITPTTESVVRVTVRDSEGTTLSWSRTEQPGTHYQVKEGIITTKPGAKLSVIVVNMIARVRWCEIFSC